MDIYICINHYLFSNESEVDCAFTDEQKAKEYVERINKNYKARGEDDCWMTYNKATLE